MSTIDAGRLRHRISIEEFVTELDSDGVQHETWQAIVDRLIPAEIVALSGRELIAAQAVQSAVTTRIRIRYRPGLKPAMRALHRDTIYNIEGVIPDPDSGRRFITLLCASGVNEG